MGEGSVQCARVHRLAKALVDQVSDIKKTYIHHDVKARHDISKFN